MNGRIPGQRGTDLGREGSVEEVTVKEFDSLGGRRVFGSRRPKFRLDYEAFHVSVDIHRMRVKVSRGGVTEIQKFLSFVRSERIRRGTKVRSVCR